MTKDFTKNYNIPKKIRELQSTRGDTGAHRIITYQEKLGNYNDPEREYAPLVIITYQEK